MSNETHDTIKVHDVAMTDSEVSLRAVSLHDITTYWTEPVVTQPDTDAKPQNDDKKGGAIDIGFIALLTTILLVGKRRLRLKETKT